MANHNPYLQRRGNHFHFRIEVPSSLRRFIGQRELTKSLKTGERTRALPLALELGAIAKRLFNALRDPTVSSTDMLKLLQAAREKLNTDILKDQHVDEIHDLRIQHRREMHVAALQAKVEAYELALARSHQPAEPTVDADRKLTHL